MAKILVVDRTMSVREAVALVLELEGHEAVQAAGGRQALALVETDQFDAVLVDAQLRDLPLPVFCAALRRLAPATSLVVMSMDAADRPASAPCAPSAFLAKPFATPALLAAVAA